MYFTLVNELKNDSKNEVGFVSFNGSPNDKLVLHGFFIKISLFSLNCIVLQNKEKIKSDENDVQGSLLFVTNTIIQGIISSEM